MQRTPSGTNLLVTRRPLSAVRVQDADALSGPVIQIPTGAKLRVAGNLSDPRLVDVNWGSARYAVFAVDLRDAERRDPA